MFKYSLGQKFTCSNSASLCKNGATCVNTNVTTVPNLALKCMCKPGFSGVYCEKGIFNLFIIIFKFLEIFSKQLRFILRKQLGKIYRQFFYNTC